TGKKPAIDNTPTGNVDPRAASAKEPATAAEADASGGTPEFRWPARGRIIEGFKSGGNDGINISVPPGTSVRAAENGVVVYSGDGLKGYGNLVLIKHPNGFVSAYANNGELDVKRGETVKRGQIIAKSGDTGNVNAPQLHFELRKGSTPVDPTQYLAGLLRREARSSLQSGRPEPRGPSRDSCLRGRHQGGGSHERPAALDFWQ